MKVLPNGSVTTPAGFRAGAVYAGIKTAGEGKLDLAVLAADGPAAAAGVFTANKVKAAPVVLSTAHLAGQRARAVVVNSGCANACTGDQGMADAEEMARLAAAKLGIAPTEVLVASTGVIGVHLPMDRIRAGLDRVALSAEGGPAFGRAILTTDTGPKETAVSTVVGGVAVTVGGAAKGAGMIHPNLATMLGFLTTDAAVEPEALSRMLRTAADRSFNLVTIDGDTSTNDSVFLLASGRAGNAPIRSNTPEAALFQEALDVACIHLAREIARGAEGATKLIEVVVEGAASEEDARLCARTVAGSSLVKCAVHGNDPNWGRILAAAGRSGAELVEARTDVDIAGVPVMRAGQPLLFDAAAASQALRAAEVRILVDLNLGPHRALAWGCNLSEDYVTFNSAYTT